MTLVNIGTDPWLLEYEACEKLSRDIMEQLHVRDKERPGSFPYDSLSGRIRMRLRQYSNEVEQLQIKLKNPEVSLTGDEKERRTRQTEELKSRYTHLYGLFDKGRGKLTAPETSGWQDDDDDDVTVKIQNNTSISDQRANQAQLLREQDDGLEQLSQVITRQKRIAVAINEEVDDQNALLDDITVNTDGIDSRVRGETNHITTIMRKDSTCGYWVVIVLLLVAIIGVFAAPGR